MAKRYRRVSDPLLDHLLAAAARNQELITENFASVLDIVNAHDIVFAIWTDLAAPRGVDLLVVKGSNEMRDVIATNTTRSLLITAIPCIEAAQAEALRQNLGEERLN